MDKEFLTVDEMCKWLKVTRKTLERWREKGLPFVKIGRSVRFEKEAVIKWIDNNKQN
jgi:excisionase family DNA binding protein